MMRQITLILCLLLTQFSFAQKDELKGKMSIDAGMTSQTLLDNNISSLIWNGIGIGTTLSYQRFIESFVLEARFSFSKLRLTNISDYEINSLNYDIEVTGMWKITDKINHRLFVGAEIGNLLNTRISDIDYRNYIFDNWVSLAFVCKYRYNTEKLYGEIQLSLPMISAVTTQDYVNNSSYSTHFAIFQNSFKINTQISFYYRLSDKSSIGLKYLWDYYSIDINKQIKNGVNYYLIAYQYNF